MSHNIYLDKTARENHIRRYLTHKGEKALESKLKELIKQYTKKPTYPKKLRILGFPVVYLKNAEQHIGMIEELMNILAIRSITVEIEDD